MKLINVILTAIILISLLISPVTAFTVKATTRDYATDADLNPSVITVNGITQIANPNTYFNNVPENQIVLMTNEVANYQTDTDDLYFDSNLRTCVGATCDLIRGNPGYEFVTHCDADQGNTWNCRVTNNNQDLYFLYFPVNDGVFVVNRLIASASGNIPVIYNLPDIVFDEDQSFILMLDNYVIDADDPDSTLTWTFSGNTNVNIVINPVTHVATFTASQEATETITFTVTDNDGNSASDTIMVIVNDIDGASPVINPALPDITFEVEDTRTLNLDNYVIDADDPDSTLTWTFSGNTNVNIVINPVTHVATFTASQEATETITFTVTDNDGNSDSDIIIVTVQEEDSDDDSGSEEKVHNLNIDGFTINKNEVNCGDQITLTIKIENTGDFDEEDASITIKSDKLGLVKTQSVNLDENDDTSLSFTFTIPEGTISGRYFFEAIINFDDDLTKNEFINFDVKCSSTISKSSDTEAIATEETKDEVSWAFIIFMLLLNLVLLLGIGFIIKKMKDKQKVL